MRKEFIIRVLFLFLGILVIPGLILVKLIYWDFPGMMAFLVQMSVLTLFVWEAGKTNPWAQRFAIMMLAELLFALWLVWFTLPSWTGQPPRPLWLYIVGCSLSVLAAMAGIYRRLRLDQREASAKHLADVFA